MKYICDCGRGFSDPDGPIMCATTFHGAKNPLESVAEAALNLVEQGLGTEEGYFPSPGSPLTEKLKTALRHAGYKIEFQRNKHNE